MNDLILYSYFRSSASYRVRAALNLKELTYKTEAINLKTGEHLLPDFNDLSSFKELPLLVHNGNRIGQSMAILQYLDDEFPDTYPLFPQFNYEKAIVVQMCEVVNSGIHPVQNLKVGKKLKKDHNFTQEDVFNWNHYWIQQGFENLELLLQKFHGEFCLGNTITAADLFLIPQIYNAKRFKVDMSQFKIISMIEHNALSVEAIKLASPGQQPDTPAELKGSI